MQSIGELNHKLIKTGFTEVNGTRLYYEDLKSLLEYLDIPKAHIAEFSMGCRFVVDFVLAFPQMNSSLITVGPWIIGYSSLMVESFFKEWRKIGSIVHINTLET